MPAFTANRGYTVPTVGGDTNTWGTGLDTTINLLDQNLSQPTSVTVAAANIVLTSSQIANLFIKLVGNLTANIGVQIPQVGGFWVVQAAYTPNGNSVVFSTLAGGGASILLSDGKQHLIVSDGTNCYLAATPST